MTVQYDGFAQVLEGPQAVVEARYARIKADSRHEAVRVNKAAPAPRRRFGKWAIAVVAEHHEPDMPMVATTGDLMRGYGRGS